MSDSYLRNRPFMLISYIRIPIAGAPTHVKDWSKAEDMWDISEKMVIVDRVSDKQLYTSDFVIDLLNNKVIKNRLGSVTDQTIINGFVDRYYNDVKTAMLKWASLNDTNVDKIRQTAKDYGIELPDTPTDT